MLSELWIHCAPLTWQEREEFWARSPFRSLARSTIFCVCIGRWLDRNYYLFTALTGQYVGSENSQLINIQIYLATACADRKGMCCHQKMLYVTNFLLLALSSAKIVS